MTALYVYRECFQHINAVAGSNVGSIRHVPASHNQGGMVSVMDTARCRALLSSNAIEAFETRMAIPTDDNPHQVSMYYRLRNLRVMEGDRYMDDAVLVVVVYNNKESWGSGRSVQDFLELVRSFDYPSAKLSLGILTSSLDEYDNLKQLLHTVETHRWEPSPAHGGWVRVVTFRSLTHAPIGPSTTMTTNTWQCTGYDWSHDGTVSQVTFQIKVQLHDIPYGDIFTVEHSMTLTKSSPSNNNGVSVKVRLVYLAIPFSSGCMFKSKILSQTKTATHESYVLWFRLLKEMHNAPGIIVDEEVALEEIFENQRMHIFGKWGPNYLWPTDRSRFSNRQGDKELSFNKVECPEHWTWTSEWKVDMKYTECDEEGWSYATDFPRFKYHLAKGKSNARKVGSSVRRRRWVRTMCLNPDADSSSVVF
ncbi:hypothetical protein DYB36_006466 [Aphanomyces astaci]|uniref:VASt domain-containing protein n=1 Tax=Aphanomyces astaci TaxID=112090 RepID=A0A397AFG5_APHAT|nr:hypothetical protein DYB36_006466 [Aphanomyces astaci]